MAKAKATHFGTCQLCGHRQKLPGGLLSKHGYTKRWGFFQGVCPGADNLPFEQSFGLIARAISNVQAQIEQQETTAAHIAQDTTKIYASVYRAATWERRQSYYEEVVLDAATTTFTAWGDFEFVDEKTGKKQKISVNALSAGERGVHYKCGEDYDKIEYVKDGCVQLANVRKVKAIKSRIAEMQEYVAWQQERIANWKAAELTAIEA